MPFFPWICFSTYNFWFLDALNANYATVKHKFAELEGPLHDLLASCKRLQMIPAMVLSSIVLQPFLLL